MFERFDKAAKYAIVVAQEEARELRAPSIDMEHVLLGLLVSPDTGLQRVFAEHGYTAAGVREALADKRTGEPLGEEDAEALRSIGIDLDAVRESLEATFGEDALERAVPMDDSRRGRFRGGKGMSFGHIPFDRDAKKVLELSLREAHMRRDDHIEAGHILLGILRAPNAATRRLLGDDAAVQTLRTAVSEYLDRAA
ncbi:MAG: ATP-dependent Clp protease ATP-binding subunit ClpC1 [Nocardia sp.]|uniref:Clp protease N-terminal domain-containing protein n=1 Tax=Nocardia sp. TaxID=1821 RepID=UPI0026347D18|nr:Clp protease N-terminal domain-containing protein [Nocardia sp.]MCU1648525.1 ATP-dependent Clp protease ATP-binding subunit ClpC1 [Nocardia sp.]